MVKIRLPPRTLERLHETVSAYRAYHTHKTGSFQETSRADKNCSRQEQQHRCFREGAA